MNDQLVEERRGHLLLSTDRSRLDLEGILTMLHASHWGAAVTRPVLARAIANSVCVGMYRGDEQLAFARAVTDLATYAYLTDVIVVPAARGHGLGMDDRKRSRSPGSAGVAACDPVHPRRERPVRETGILNRDAGLDIYGDASRTQSQIMTARRIVGFHQDEEHHWVAELECGHTQHVRHDPPWQLRPWVVTPEGRQSFLGATLNCVECDRL